MFSYFYSELNLLFGWRSQFCSSVISHPWCTDPSQLVSFPFSLEVEWWIQDQQVMSPVHACYASMAMSVTTNNGSVECLHTWKLKILKDAILPGTITSAESKERAYAQLVQFLDSRSLNLVMHDAQDDGRKALQILRRHYAGTGKQRIISMYTTLCSLYQNSQAKT